MAVLDADGCVAPLESGLEEKGGGDGLGEGVEAGCADGDEECFVGHGMGYAYMIWMSFDCYNNNGKRRGAYSNKF